MYSEPPVKSLFYSRVVKRLTQKNDQQKDLEKKEQGFTLYLNGANQEFDKNRTSPTKHAKTARGIRKSWSTTGTCGKNALCELFTIPLVLEI